jgi:hypothetical protein
MSRRINASTGKRTTVDDPRGYIISSRRRGRCPRCNQLLHLVRSGDVEPHMQPPSSCGSAPVLCADTSGEMGVETLWCWAVEDASARRSIKQLELVARALRGDKKASRQLQSRYVRVMERLDRGDR